MYNETRLDIACSIRSVSLWRQFHRTPIDRLPPPSSGRDMEGVFASFIKGETTEIERFEGLVAAAGGHRYTKRLSGKRNLDLAVFVRGHLCRNVKGSGRLHGIELLGIGLVFGHGDFASVHDPFTDTGDLLAVVCPCRNGINTPVNEKTELRLAEPCQASITLHLGLMGIGSIESVSGWAWIWTATTNPTSRILKIIRSFILHLPNLLFRFFEIEIEVRYRAFEKHPFIPALFPFSSEDGKVRIPLTQTEHP